MLIDGHQVAARVQAEAARRLSRLARSPHLTIFTSAPAAVTKRYLGMKQAQARELGINARVVDVAPEMDTAAWVAKIEAALPHTDAVVVQLPLPDYLDRAAVLAAVPSAYDVDALGPAPIYHSPVVGAIAAMVEQYTIPVPGAPVVVLGAGALVGAPVAEWFTTHGAQVTTITETTPNPEALAAADIVVSGVGKPGLVQPEQLKPGVVIFDAGTSETGGELRGDVAPACVEVASYMTPVPGGIGPVTIAVLLANVVTAAEKRSATG